MDRARRGRRATLPTRPPPLAPPPRPRTFPGTCLGPVRPGLALCLGLGSAGNAGRGGSGRCMGGRGRGGLGGVAVRFAGAQGGLGGRGGRGGHGGGAGAAEATGGGAGAAEATGGAGVRAPLPTPRSCRAGGEARPVCGGRQLQGCRGRAGGEFFANDRRGPARPAVPAPRARGSRVARRVWLLSPCRHRSGVGVGGGWVGGLSVCRAEYGRRGSDTLRSVPALC